MGRRSQLNQLESALFIKGQPPKTAITGLGGMGKTQIALELAYRTREKHPDCSVFWISATNAEGLEQAFTDIGQQLRIPGLEKELAGTKELVQRYLSQGRAGRWLLIVDNIDDMDIWRRELKDYLPEYQRGRIVCTTRSRKVAVDIAASNVIQVPEMEEEMAMQLLSKSLVNKELLLHHQDVRKLLQQLTFLPLAIVQAAAYINKNGTALSKYSSLLEGQEQNMIDILSEDFEDDWRYKDIKNPVATTWLISFEQIWRLDPLAADYLSFASCVAPKNIPWSLLPPGPSAVKQENAIGTLDAYSFVTRRNVDESFDVHRLVQLTTRSWLRTKNQLHDWTSKTLKRLVEVIPLGGHGQRQVWTAYLPHAVYTTDLIEVRAVEERVVLMDRIGHCEITLGRYKAAESTYRQVLERRQEVLGRGHPSTLASMSNLAQTLSDQGKYADAETMHRDTLALMKTVLGEDHQETLASISDLAQTLSDQGKYADAETMHRDTLALTKTVLGEDHPETLASMNNLAQTLSRQGKYADAETMHRDTLVLKKTVLGEDHPETLASMNNLAQTLSRQGKYADAETMHRDTLALVKTVLGEDHPSTLISMNNLAQTLSRQGKYADAETMYRDTLALRKTMLGEDHPETLAG